MITVKEVDKTYFDLYDQVSMNVEIHSYYKLKRLDSGLADSFLKRSRLMNV